MNEIKKGDNVTRNSYNNDVIFCVKKIIKLPNNKKGNVESYDWREDLGKEIFD